MNFCFCIFFDFNLPDPAECADPQRMQSLIDRMRNAGSAFVKSEDAPFVEADASHLADAVEHIERLAAVIRRARACAPRPPEEE